MNKPLQKIIEETLIRHELFPMDFFYSNILEDKKELTENFPGIYIERYNQKFIKVKNSHRPVSKMLSADLIIKNDPK
jgi:hypothetical protein